MEAGGIRELLLVCVDPSGRFFSLGDQRGSQLPASDDWSWVEEVELAHLGSVEVTLTDQAAGVEQTFSFVIGYSNGKFSGVSALR